MTVHDPIPTAASERQRLLTACRNAQWALLQEFARLEHQLARVLGPQKTPKTFGAKLKAIPRLRPRDWLTDERNLLAHAQVFVVELDKCPVAIFSVADDCRALNARLFTAGELESWKQTVLAGIKHALADLRIS